MAQDHIRSGAEVDYPPFSIADADGLARGFSVELMRASLAAMNREVTFRTGPWAEVRGWLERGEIDALPLVGRTPEREALFDFTFPYMSLHGAIVVREDAAGIRRLEDLRGRDVAVMKGDNAEEFLKREDRGMTIHSRGTFEEALRELSEGRHDAVVIQRLVALRLIAEGGLKNLKVIDRPIEGFRQDFCFAVREGDRGTLALLNEGLAIVMADGTYRHLHARWFAALELPPDRRIMIGGDHNYPPYEFIDQNGRPSGYNVELTRAIAHEMGLEVEFRLGPWSDVVRDLENGDIDVIQGMFYSPERDLKFDFSPPHEVNHYVAVTRKGELEPPSTLEDLKNLRIVVQRGDFIHNLLAAHGTGDQVHLVETQEDVLRELAEGKHDCAIAVRISALHLVERNGWKNLQLGRRPMLSMDYCFAVLKARKALMAQFSEGLKVLEENGEYRRIHDKWLGVYRDQPPSLPSALRASAVVLLPLLVLFLTGFAWSWSLRRQVAQKTRELRESLDRFQYVFEAANVSKSLTLPTGEINVNLAYADFVGYTPEELRNRKWQELTPPEEIELITQRLAPLLEGHEDSTRFEKRYLRKDGSCAWGDVSTRIRRDELGNPLYFVTTIVDITRQKRNEERIEHLLRVLRAVRNVNQLITQEKNRDLLLVKACDVLTETRGYRSAWIGLLDGRGGIRAVAESGIGDDFDRVAAQLEGGALPECCRRVMVEPNPVVMHYTSVNCIECPLAPTYRDTATLAGRLHHAGHDYGVLVVALPASVADDEQEQDLFLELAEDIGFALYGIEAEHERVRAEVERERSNAVLSRLLEVARELAGATSFNSVIRIMRQAARALIGADGVTVVLRDGERCRYVDEDAIEPLWKGRWFPINQCISGWVMQNRDSVAIEDIHKDTRFPLDAYRETFVRSLAMAPIRSENPVGAIGAYWRERHEATEVERSVLAALGNMAASVWDAIEARESLRSSEATLRAIFENMQDGALMMDAENRRFVIANNAICRSLGYTREELLTLGLGDIHPREALPLVEAELERRIKGNAALGRDIPLKRRDGSVFEAEISTALLELEGRLHLLGVFRDITERKRAETEQQNLQAQLIQAQKMESVGRLAGGVAHDFNNILSVIIGYTELALCRIAPQDAVHADLNEILGAAIRSRDIIRQLLAFARQEAIAPEVLDLNVTVENMLKILRRLIGEDIELAWMPKVGLWPVLMDPAQIDQILANLCINARDAISDVGRIAIRTNMATLDEAYCSKQPGAVPGDFVVLSVSDDGCGMDPETLGKIFEPFFTTKELGRGTGLGLATVYGIVKQNQGFIDVVSEPGRGTTFEIFLPRVVGQAPDDRRQNAVTLPRGSGETLLVVEDELSVLKLVVRFLSRLNYRVLSAETPSEALETAAENAGRIDLLITDVVMPGMNGKELAERVRSLCPNLECLYMSGYTADVIAHHGVLDKGVWFIQKPFSVQDLAAKVRDVLNRQSSHKHT